MDLFPEKDQQLLAELVDVYNGGGFALTDFEMFGENNEQWRLHLIG